ncbi:MAG: TRAP transporter substrate-binding protein [Lentimonas sp.]
MNSKTSYLSFGFLVGLIAACTICAFLRPSNTSTGSAEKRMKLGHNLPTTHPVHAGLEYFVERVFLHSGGQLNFDIFPNGQLGNEPQSLEQIQAGTLDATKVGSATLGSFVPVTKVFSLPYLFRNEAHYWNVLNGDIGHDILQRLSMNADGQDSQLRGLTFYDSGSRNFYTKRPINTPADLEGLKIRVMNDPVAMDMVAALGASPTPISFGELYTALQQGVVDGAENNPPSFVTSRHLEVIKDFSFDHHSRNPDILIFSAKIWEQLSDIERGWIEEAAEESSAFQRKAWATGVEESLAEMRAQGVTILEPDLKPFIEATAGVRAKYGAGELQSLLEQIGDTSD